MSKRLYIAALFLAGAMGSSIAFRTIGSQVDETGRLVEPFFLIPLGWLCLMIGAALLAVSVISSIVAKCRSKLTNAPR